MTEVAPDLAELPALLAARGGSLGSPFVARAVTGSTNDDAKAGAKDGAPHGALWVADMQTAGRGRQGRAWVATPGESLLFSVLLRVPCSVQRLPPLALAAGLAVHDALVEVAGSPAPRLGVKWPNDVLIGEKKVAGILVESLLAGDRATAVIVGCGINLAQTAFPDDIAHRATSIRLATGAAPRRDRVLAAVLAGLDTLIPLVAGRGLAPVLPRLRAVDVLFGRAIAADLGSAGGGKGTAEGIDDDGHLLVRDATGVLHRLGAGEVHLGETFTSPG
jgi:BirA family biotin operon repressor/biotin-[acetyl-CoA-carboxylase] ligase